jgi:hypothetical protein
MLNQWLGNHKTYENKDGEIIMRGCVNDCVVLANGNPDLTGRVLEWAV